MLYFFESNTRSATVIGAIVGGGIGLLLTQAIQTQKDWEDVAYYMILIVLMVMLMEMSMEMLMESQRVTKRVTQRVTQRVT